MTYSPLGVGGLSGVYTPGQPPPAGTLTPPGAPAAKPGGAPMREGA